MLGGIQPVEDVIKEFESDIYSSADYVTGYELVEMIFTHPEKFNTDKWY